MGQFFQMAFRSVLSFLPENGSPIALEGGILPLRPLGELISLAYRGREKEASFSLNWSARWKGSCPWPVVSFDIGPGEDFSALGKKMQF